MSLKDFSDLILIIGTNPLPNYVVTKYFIRENKHLERIWMICSEDKPQCNQKSTKEYAGVLKALLKNDKLEFSDLILVSDIGSKRSIQEALEKMVSQIKNHNVHLSFTGGTKAMSTYSYSYLKSEIKNFSASYLSARSFKIKFDDNIVSYNLRDSIKISFDDLLKLYLFEKNDEENDKYEGFNDVTNKFQELIEQDRIDNFYSKEGSFNENIFKEKNNSNDINKIFKNIDKFIEASNDQNVFKEKFNKIPKNNEKRNFERRVKIFKSILNYKPNAEFQSVVDTFPEEYKIYKNGAFNANITEEHYRHAVKFLDGFWFEKYVGKIVSEYLRNDFDEIKVNQKPHKVNSQKNEFELDIVLMKGYQLIGTSCTTSSSKHICKEKGFEIILRTRQIGGEEAKAILITRANGKIVKKLQSELELSTGTAQKNILVLGFDDWKQQDMIEKIKNFIF